jgi:hypothetical protein
LVTGWDLMSESEEQLSPSILSIIIISSRLILL